MRCCEDLFKFLLFLANFLCFLAFAGLLSGTVYLLLNGENTFIGQQIEPSLSSDDPTNATYFLIIVILLVIFSFFALFTCLGCCGAAFKSGCMLGSFLVILIVLFGGAVGALIFLHTQHGWEAVMEVLNQEMTSNLLTYRESSILTFHFWDWLQQTFECCGVVQTQGWKIWLKVAESKGLRDSWKVPDSCCRSWTENSWGSEGLTSDDTQENECMYEPSQDNVFTSGCAERVILYVQIILYGVPIIMFISMVISCVVISSIGKVERRRKAALHGESRGLNTSQYSVGADEDFQHHHSYPSAPADNLPYNPHYDTHEMQVAMPAGGNFQAGGVGMYNAGPIGNYPTGTVPPPQGAHVPLLHQPPPSYNEVVYRK